MDNYSSIARDSYKCYFAGIEYDGEKPMGLQTAYDAGVSKVAGTSFFPKTYGRDNGQPYKLLNAFGVAHHYPYRFTFIG